MLVFLRSEVVLLSLANRLKCFHSWLFFKWNFFVISGLRFFLQYSRPYAQASSQVDKECGHI